MLSRSLLSSLRPSCAALRVLPHFRALSRRWLCLVAVYVGLPSSPVVAGFSNPSFELNNFNGWTLEYARDTGFGVTWQSAIPANHPIPQIVTSATFGNTTIPAAPCGNYMAQLNDMAGDAHTTRIFQTCTLSASDFDACGVATLTVCWIAALCDPGHHPSEQPRFQLELFHDHGGTLSLVHQLTVTSGVVTSTPGSGWRSAGLCSGTPLDGQIRYKSECTTIPIFDLHLGDQLTVRMTVRDCTQRAHGGMAFLDCVDLRPGLPDPVTSVAPDQSCFGDTDLPMPPSPLLVPATWGTTPSSTSCKSLRVAGDFNRDGLSDVAEYRKFSPSGFCSSSGGIWTLVSSGSSFATQNPNAATGAALGGLGWDLLKSGDFDGDGYYDVLGLRSDGTTARVAWGSTAGLTTVTTPGVIGPVGSRKDYWVGDFNGDGRDDIARIDPAGLSGSQGISVARGQPPGVCAVNRLSPFLNFANWSASFGADTIQINGAFYAGDFNGDGLCDLAASMPAGIYLYRSTGSSFAKPILWFSGAGLPPGGFIVGDFNCDGVCDLARRNWGTGYVEMLIGFSFTAGFGIPATPPFLVNWSRLSYTAVSTPSLLAGDFDGNGRDDFIEPSVPNVAKVHRACEPCPCLELKAGTPLCDPNDATKYTLPLMIRNLTPYPLSDVTLQGLTGFTVSPASVSVLSPCGAQLLPRKSRSVTVMVNGVTANVLHEIRASVLLLLPGGGIYVCDDRACFTPPPCSCMQTYSANAGPWYECEPTASGAACLNLAVKNISGTTVCGVRVTSLTPGVIVSPGIVCIPPLPTGSLHSFSSCDFQFTGSSSSGVVALRVELLNCITTGCDDCACNVVCDDEISFDYSLCPREIGECCIAQVGLQFLTYLDCQAAGGVWAPPGTSLYCPMTWGSTAASTIRIQPIGADAFLTFNAEQRLFISQIPADGTGGADITVSAARLIAIPLEEISSDDGAILPTATVRVDGTFGGAPNARLGELVISRNADETFNTGVDFSAIGATGVELTHVFDGDPISTQIMGPVAAVTFANWPTGIKVVAMEGRQGFRFEFLAPTQIQAPGLGTAQAIAFSLTAVTAPALAEHLTRLELRAAGVSRIASGIFVLESTPCMGDLNGDCRINQADLNILTAALGGGLVEADVNGDGMINIADLQTLLASLNTTCACADSSPPVIPGDTNCDGVITGMDIGSFVLAVMDSTAYSAQFPGCDIHSADLNADGFVTVSDIAPFVALLTGS